MLAVLAISRAPHVQAQGVLTVTPGRSIATVAGTGAVGFSGDGAASPAAELARPSGIAYDAAGNLFLADANNHVIREVNTAGIISTVAGTGVAGFGGDGGPASAAFLDTPTGVAVDASGNLYIADSHNHRIRKVSGGTITTVAGTGNAGFSGDGGSAVSAQLALPSAVALDASGTVFIADTNNNRIRKLSAGLLTSVAGNGEELFAGDGGQALFASLDQPTGVVLDAAGNLYIADKNNHRIRMVNTSGGISTLAGNGNGAFSGSFAGEGAPATTASLAKPVSLSIDAVGNLLVVDTNNQRIRQISPNGTIATVIGTGDQGYAGDSGPAAAAILNSPRTVALDSTGDITIADTSNGRLRGTAPGKLSFALQPVGSTSAPQILTLGNTGTAPFTVSSLAFSGPFSAGSGASCSATPIVLSPGATCTVNIAFQPTAAGATSGFVTLGGAGVVSQTVLLAGTASIGSTSLLVSANQTSLLSGEPLTFTAALTTANGTAVGATGSIAFYDGTQLLGTSPVSQGVATLTTSALPDGTQAVTAVYSGTTSFAASTSSSLIENVADLSLTLNALQTTTIVPGHTAAVPFALSTTGATGLSANVTLSASNLPPGLTVSFAPPTRPVTNGQLPFTMNVTAAPAGTSATAALTASSATFALLLIPVLRRRSLHGVRRLRPLALFLFSLGGLLCAASLAGCGGGFFGQKPETYNITVTATATDASGGTLTRSTSVPIIVE